MTRLLVATQCTERDSPKNSGLWGYDLKGRGRSPGNNSEDHSNGQFAVLALRDAVHAGVQVDRKVWERVLKCPMVAGITVDRKLPAGV